MTGKRTLCVAAVVICCAGATWAQALGTPVGTTSGVPVGTGGSTSQTAQSAINSLNASQNPFLGSTTTGQPTPEVLNLTILDALDRGLKANLGLILTQQGTETARAALLRARSILLPNVEATSSVSVQQINLEAFGFPATPGQRQIRGPFGVFDIRGALTQSIFDLPSVYYSRAAGQNEQAARFTYRNARDLVVLVVGGAYLQAIAGTARVDAAKSQFDTAKVLYDRAVNLKAAGVVPAIDVLRAQVQMQSQQQRLLAAQNDLEKQKLTLARTIGLPTGQRFNLADTIPLSPPPPLTLDEALKRAYDERPDYKSAQASVRAAELGRKSASSQRYPTLAASADYGATGPNIGNSHGTFAVGAQVRIPIFEGGRIRADEQQAEAQLRQAQAQANDLRGRIEFDVRTAFLDMTSAYEQVQVAQSATNLAREQLQQAQDRFSAGVTNNLEVVQAQDALALTNENYIASLFAFNFAKLSLARALGIAEDATKSYLGGRR